KSAASADNAWTPGRGRNPDACILKDLNGSSDLEVLYGPSSMNIVFAKVCKLNILRETNKINAAYEDLDMSYGPYVDPELELLVDRLHPPRVCIDNDSYHDCTLVKGFFNGPGAHDKERKELTCQLLIGQHIISLSPQKLTNHLLTNDTSALVPSLSCAPGAHVDSANKHGILLAMVQVLTDLDLVISKSYICSDGRWFMDVFHVTDQLGNKITDKNLIHYLQQSICTSRIRGKTRVKTTNLGKQMRQKHMSMEHTTLEMTTTDRPGILSEISAVLAELRCHVSAAVAWTHNTRAACIIHVEDDSNLGSIMNPQRVDRVQAQLETVVNAHHTNSGRPNVRLTSPATGQTHAERRLHQLMMADKDYEGSTYDPGHKPYDVVVTVEDCQEKGYSILNITSPDRPKLLFDTVCTLTDLHYVVFHATVSSKGSVAFQGLRLDVRSRNRSGLLSDVTRVFRENGLSIAGVEIGIHGEKAVGSFHVTDAGGHEVGPGMVELVKKEIEKFGGTVILVANGSSSNQASSNNSTEDDGSRSSLGTMLWSHLERLSSKFQTLNSQS
ncbi:ACT domain-containing protein ACR1, partial [Tanacetum coccineum]